MTHATATVLQALANGCVYGFDIMDNTGLPGGTVYPALRRMELAGWITSQWEKEGIAQREGRPPRKYYELTPAGEEALASAAERYRTLGLLEAQSKAKASPAR
jgi:DNA-binding PadR family transcriptional regulator